MRRHVRLGSVGVAIASLVVCVVTHAQDTRPWEKSGTKVGDEILGPDGGKMVWVPAGEFTMGSSPKDVEAAYRLTVKLFGYAKKQWFSDEVPAHQVRITKGFWLGQCMVTNAQFRRYSQETGASYTVERGQSDDHAIIWMTWAQAKAYCAHYGLDLPTEAEWEYAARGPQGRKYPWGNEWDPEKCSNDANQFRVLDGGALRPFSVGSFPEGASWCGALDMASLFWQWCEDWSSDNYAHASGTDPAGPKSGERRALRGGCMIGHVDTPRSARRYSCCPDLGGNMFGFRCVARPEAR